MHVDFRFLRFTSKRNKEKQYKVKSSLAKFKQLNYQGKK